MLLVWPLLALWSFAIAQPLYDLLLQNPTYLTAHELIGWRLILFITVVGLLLPLGLVALLIVPAYAHRSLRPAVPVLWTLAALGLLIALFNGLLRKMLPDLGSAAELGLAVLGSSALLWFVRRNAAVLEFLRLAALSALLFPVIFLWQLPASFLAGEREDSTYELTLDSVGPDIVLVVFDELALTTMLDDQQLIDKRRLPNFAALAAEATWYRQASAVAASTRLAIPAILTGTAPESGKTSNADSHPRNLFSMLRDAYAFNVEEPITRLCVFPKCRRIARLWLVVLDTAVVLGHIGAPKWIVHRLPPIGGHWVGFWTPGANAALGGSPADERILSINRFVEGLASTPSPGLHVLHSVLPHVPYTILPSGARLLRHGNTPGHLIDRRGGDRFVDKPWAVTESRYQYEWQLKFVDAALGRIVAQLKALDKFEDTLLIVTADHGFRLVPGKFRRAPNVDSYIDIASIPMLVKLPGQNAAKVDERVFQSTDILGVIESALGLEKSTIAPHASQGRTILSSSALIELPAQFDFSTTHNLPASTVKRNNNPAFNLPSTNSEACRGSPEVTLGEEKVYQHTYPEHFLAAHVLFRTSAPLDAASLVVRVNDKASGVHQTGENQYSAFVDPEWLQAGYNSIQLLRSDDGGICSLYELPAS